MPRKAPKKAELAPKMGDGRGRPRRHTISEKETLEKARSLGRRNMLRLMETWLALLEAPEGTNYSARLTACKEIADRCGFRFDPNEAPSDIGRTLLEIFTKMPETE